MGRVGRAMVWLWGKTPWGKAAAAEAAEKAAVQAARRKAIEEGGEGAVDIARQTVGRARKGSTSVGASVVIALIGIGVGLLFPPSIPGVIGGTIAGMGAEKAAEAAIGVLAAPATPTPKPEKTPMPTEEPAPVAPRQPIYEEQPQATPAPQPQNTPSVVVIQSTPHPDDDVDIETPEPSDDHAPPPDDGHNGGGCCGDGGSMPQHPQ